MSARDYVDKLPVLYLEFAEAARLDEKQPSRIASFASAEELMRNTPMFWEKYVLPKINSDFGKAYVFLNDPYPNGPNPYLQRVEENLARLRQKLAAPRT
jgi:hypothetical protein